MEAIDITGIVEAVFTLIIAVIGAYYTYIRNKSDNAAQLDKWVEIAVYAAEQAYKTGVTSDRKNYALQVLKDKGMTLDWNQVDTMIEAAVNKMPSGGSYSYTQKGKQLDVIEAQEVHK